MSSVKGGTIDVPLTAGGTISQYEPVMLDTSDATGLTVIRVAATTDIPYGVAQQDAVSGQSVDVRTRGETLMRCGSGGVTVGLLAGIDSSDKTEIANITEAGSGTTLAFVYGQICETKTNNQMVRVNLLMTRTLV